MKTKKSWTTRMLLNEILSYSGSEWHNKKIIALLKAFDLYVDNRDETHKKLDLKSIIFITNRDRREVLQLLQEFSDLAGKGAWYESENTQFFLQVEDDLVHKLVMSIFHNLLVFRKSLHQTMQYDSNPDWDMSDELSDAIIKKRFLRNIKLQLKKIDGLLLKIIGEHEPIAESELIEKYGFPEIGAYETIEDIINEFF